MGTMWRRLRALFHRQRLADELAEEMRLHLELRAAEHRAAGLDPEEARYAARRRFGNVALLKETSREAWGWRWLEALGQDLRYALRLLRRNPAVTAAAVLTLALGTGATTVIFSVVDRILLRALPYPEADKLVMVYASFAPQNVARGWLSPADYWDWSARNRAFEQIAAFARSGFTIRGNQEPQQVLGALVTSEFFTVLRVRPLLGRTFVPDDVRPGGPQAVILSERLWRRAFGAEGGILGRSVLVGGRAATVVGVMPAGFDFPYRGAELWAALLLTPPTRRGPFFLRGLARLRPGASREQAQAELDVLARGIEQAYPKTYSRLRFPAVSLHEALVSEFRSALVVAFGAVLVLLVVACVNVANLLQARAAGRDREMAVRLSLGAGLGRLARQLVTESTVLALAGGTAGVALAFWGLELLRGLIPGQLPLLRAARIDTRVLAFSLLATVLTGLAFGLAPALRLRRCGPSEALRAGGRAGEGLHAGHARSGLIVAQVALCCVLLVAAGLLLRSFLLLRAVPTGLSARDVLAMTLAATGEKYAAAGSAHRFYDQVLESVRTLPGVEAAAVANCLPPTQFEFSDSFRIEGQPFVAESYPSVPVLIVSPEYFRALGIPLVRGRDFSARDTMDAPGVVIISESLARRYFTHEDPLGKRFKLGGPGLSSQPWREIVGVAGDVKYRGLAAPVEPAYYLPYRQVPSRWMYLFARASGDPLALAPAVRARVRTVDAEVVMAITTTLERTQAESIAQPRFRTWLLGLFAAAALLLAAVGVYGVVAWSVKERWKEFGLRLAMGAGKGDVLALVLRRACRLLLAGIALGLVGAVLTGRAVASLLFGVRAADPATYAVVCGILLGAGLLAAYLPARRAANLDPVEALRHE